jgi:MOSC domain-containing protein
MKLAEIWRYPVKSMAGERLEAATIGELGVGGDRVVHVEDGSGRVVTARRYPRLLGHRGTLVPSGEPLVDGRPWNDPDVEADVVAIVGPGARLVRHDDRGRFDILPLLVATDGAIRAFGYDGRRLRPNLVIGGVDGLAERAWSGRRLHIGDVRIGIRDLRARCVMTTFDPDTLAQDPEVLESIVRRFAGKLALDCFVVHGGEIRVGDDVALTQEDP